MTLDELSVNTIRFLAVDMVQAAKSGHPGAPMGQAAMAYTVWQYFLKHNPQDPSWPDRDRFVLSCGHSSALLYALLHLTGYDISIEELKRFRKRQSKTPGHPEYGLTPGVETTTGPLGQGFANAVGMAISERWLASHYNRPQYEIINHHIYVMTSDGDMMEGISHEAASLAGTLKLGNLICFYDDNGISIEGETHITFTEDVGQRFRSYGWQVVGPIDGMNVASVALALKEALSDTGRPSLIICKTTIGYGSPHKQGTPTVHGEPLGEEEVLLAKKNLGWPYTTPFTIPHEVLTHLRQGLEKGVALQNRWMACLASYREAYPEEYAQLQLDLAGTLPPGWDEGLEKLFSHVQKPLATRDASGEVLNTLCRRIHALAGGSADLAPSTKTILNGAGHFGPEDYSGHNVHFGVREHAMAAIATGMALHRGIIPYAATFLIFYDYMRPAVRLAAMMKQRVVFIFTHDSIGLGEDGPTHQPIEQLVGLRSVPNLVLIRPADATETAMAWQIALSRNDGPTAIALTRQKVPVFPRSLVAPASGVYRGAYVLWDASPAPQLIIIATGSEVHLALDAGRQLETIGIPARVVSMPSWELFDTQPEEYRSEVLPEAIRARISIEAGVTLGWERYIGKHGIAIGVNSFGFSAPYEDIYKQFGLTTEHIVEVALELIRKLGSGPQASAPSPFH